MNMNDNILLRKMAEDARGDFDVLLDRMSSVEDILHNRVDGKSRFRMIADIIVSALWIAFYIVLLTVGLRIAQNTFIRIVVMFGALAGILLSVLLVFSNFRNYKYYGTFLGFMAELKETRRSLQGHVDGIPAELDTLFSAREEKWNKPLLSGQSIPSALDRMEKAISGIGILNTATIQRLISYAFFTASLIGTFTIGFVAVSLCMDFIVGIVDINENTIRTIVYVVLCITSIASAWLIWGMKSANQREVTNLTMLAPVAGGAATLVVIAALALVAALVYLALYIVGVVLAVVCICACANGG